MFLSRVQVFIITMTLFVFLPVLILSGLFFLGKDSFFGAIHLIIVSGNLIFLLFKAGPWEFTWFYLRHIIFLAYLAVSVLTIIFNANAPFVLNYGEYIIFAAMVVALFLNINAVRALKRPAKCLNLEFPFKNGRYLVTDGGDGSISSLVNYHNKAQVHKRGNSNSSMRFATDIVKLDKKGFTVSSPLTSKNESYAIYNQKVYSPCDAVVVEVVDGIENNIPFSRNFPYNVGNHVVLKKDNNYIVMGHLNKNTITVREGDTVSTHQLLGLIGNSGLTPRPHLHMQVSEAQDSLFWTGRGVPISFNNLPYPVKNTLLKV